MLYIASDHGGFKLKNKLIEKLREENILVKDMGPKDLDPKDDYPDTTKEAIKRVQEDIENKAVLICRNGVGVNIFANKHKGIRAGLSWSTKHAKSQKTDDNTNILTLPADYISANKAAKIVKMWLQTDFQNKKRHERRLAKIKDVEN